MFAPTGRSALVGAWKPAGTVGVRQELRVVKMLSVLGTADPVDLRRQRRELAVVLIVLECIVVVGDEEGWRRPQGRAVQAGNLVVAHSREDRRVLRVQHRNSGIERPSELGP